MKTTTTELSALSLPAAAEREAVDARLVSVLRCVLAISGQIIAWLDPADPLYLGAAVVVVLSAYSVYSVALSYTVFTGRPFVAPRLQPWIDVAMATCLIAMTQAASSVFFHFFFFAILVASFTRGYREGFAMTMTATLLFIASEHFFPSGAEFELDRLLIRPVYLVLLGYMIAHWGGQEIQMRRRLWLLKEIGGNANPRFGIEQTLAMHLRRLAAYFDAGGVLLVCPQGGSAECRFYRVEAGPGAPLVSEAMTDGAAGALLQFASHTVAAFNRKQGLPSFLSRPVWKLSRGAVDAAIEARCERVANLLETPRFITAPYRQHQRDTGRLYVFGGKRFYREEDAQFLSQAVDQVAAAMDKLILLEELMRNAANLERSRISRDIHDTTIQPYIGLKIGLEALHRRLQPGTAVERQVRELIGMSGAAIEDLRNYVVKLRGGGPGWPGENLLASLREQVQRYRDYYGIDVDLRHAESVQISDRVAGEAYQIMCEGLSNVHRHTEARKAFVELRAGVDRVVVRVGNERRAGLAGVEFMPRSILERVAALGGETEVLNNEGYDVVEARIPL
jgi:signal transduction histidine kinase